MRITALQVHAAALGAVQAEEFRGATTAVSFGNPSAEFSALRETSAVYDLGYRAKIALTGGDRVRWLNGMVTNNIRDLQVGQGVYAFLLNPQGHILGDLFAYNHGESIVVETDCSQLEKILATFDHYIIMDDVEVKNLSDQLTALGVAGPNSREVLQAAGFAVGDLMPLNLQDLSWQGVSCTLVRGDAEHVSYEVWLAPANVKQLWDALLTAGATPVGSEAIEMQRVTSGVPLYGVDIRERDLPQETEQARALNFNKGCYVGQEIVERIRSRGNVHRKFTGFVATTSDSIAPGTKISVGEKEVGEITSAATVLNGHQHHVALGYIRREVGVPGKEVGIGPIKAVVTELPFRDV